MTKFFAIATTLAAALLIAVTAFTTAANAGCGSKHGFRSHQSFSSNHQAKKRAAAKRRAIAAKRAAAKRRAIAAKKAAAKRRIIAAKKAAAKKARIAAAKAKATQEQINETKVSKVDDKPFDKPVSVAAVAGAVTEFTNSDDTNIDNETQEVASNEEVGCKKYIASAGLTINVPCAN